jgi:hypothetical protein
VKDGPLKGGLYFRPQRDGAAERLVRLAPCTTIVVK